MPLPTQVVEVSMHLSWLLRSIPPGTPILRRRLKAALAYALKLRAQTKTPQAQVESLKTKEVKQNDDSEQICLNCEPDEAKLILEVEGFDEDITNWVLPQPVWGTCP